MSTREIIAIGSAANDGTGDTLRSAGAKINNNNGKIFFALGGDSDALSDHVSFTDSGVAFTFGSNVTTIIPLTPTANRTVSIPDASGVVLLDSATQTLTNKTLDSATLTTPEITGGSNVYRVVGGSLAADRDISLPVLASDDTFTFIGATQTLTNKTLDSATVNNPVLTGNIYDENGAEILTLTATSSAVNYFTKANAAASGSPTLSVGGSDTNIALALSGKGTGPVSIAKVAHTATTITANGAISTSGTYFDCNKGSALALTLADGTVAGEMKILTNRGAGTATVTPTSFAHGTSFAIAQNEAAQIIWDGNNWFLVGNQSVTTIA